jgi:site-specific recombinase XerD
LFVGNQADKAISTRSVERIVKSCCKIAGVSNIVPHSFRHGTAHNILERGGTVADVQKTLGHRSPLSSMKYLQYSDREHERRSKMFFLNQSTISTFAPFDLKQGLIYDEVNSEH